MTADPTGPEPDGNDPAAAAPASAPEAQEEEMGEVVVAPGHRDRALLEQLRGKILSLEARLTVHDKAFDKLDDTVAAAEAAGQRMLEQVRHLSGDDPTPEDPTPGEGEPAAASGGAAEATVSGLVRDEEPAVELGFRELVAWARENVLEVVDRAPSTAANPPFWCAQWWRHAEALSRLDAAHSSWMEAVRSPVGNARVVYWEHLDHQLGMLTGDKGPFRDCAGGHDADADTRGLAHIEPDEDTYREWEAAQPAPLDSAPPSSPPDAGPVPPAAPADELGGRGQRPEQERGRGRS